MQIIKSASFKKNVKKYRKDREIIKRLQNHIRKIIENPEVGVFLKGQRKGERKIYIPPFRLLYAYSKDEDTLYLLDFDHRDIICDLLPGLKARPSVGSSASLRSGASEVNLG